MDSKTAIVNAALLLVGDEELTDLDAATSTTGRIAQRWYPHTRDTVIRSYTWNFALARQALSLLAANPAFEFGNQFTLPTDPFCLRALSIFDSDSEWRVEGRKLLTDDGSVNLKYISRVTDVAQFDDLYTDALIYKLASNMAFAIMRDRLLKRELQAEYLIKVQEARTADSMEGTFDRIASDVFLRTRRVGSLIPPVTPPSSAGSPR
ncbi:hypothetical protein LCGC14_1431360 [marine sediment metagenome]|uniref:Tail tubular protein A n=1 Tax=marine sediment metagenome TaxID=412755 RepID=A0A0F9MQ81_9ZZZZ